MRYIILVPEVHVNTVSVEADSLDSAFAILESEGVNLDEVISFDYSHTLEQDEFKVQLPNGEQIPADEALDRESIGERIGE